jgi:hypothetical protein
VFEIPLLAATAENLKGYGHIVDAPETFPIEIIRWPTQGWRPVDANSGDQGGVTEGTFEFWWKGDTLHAITPWRQLSVRLESIARAGCNQRRGQVARESANLARQLSSRWRPVVLSDAWPEFRGPAGPSRGRHDA